MEHADLSDNAKLFFRNVYISVPWKFKAKSWNYLPQSRGFYFDNISEWNISTGTYIPVSQMILNFLCQRVFVCCNVNHSCIGCQDNISGQSKAQISWRLAVTLEQASEKKSQCRTQPIQLILMGGRVKLCEINRGRTFQHGHSAEIMKYLVVIGC